MTMPMFSSRYWVLTDQLIRAYNTFTNEEEMEAAFILESMVMVPGGLNQGKQFDYNGINTTSKQIFTGDTTIGTFGRIYAITFGNNESRHPAIDRDGKTVVFEFGCIEIQKSC